MNKKIYTTSKRGFTLIELLIVIAIIGILAGTILVSLNSSRSKATNVRTLAEVAQIRSQFEQSYQNSAFTAISGSGSNVDALIATSSAYQSLSTLVCDIGAINNYPSGVTGDIVQDCGTVTGAHTGVVIYSPETSWNVTHYGVYAALAPSGYVCVDSFGNTVSTTTSTIPDYSSIVSTSTALCQ